MKEFIDASVFLGMHHKDERIRVACKNYFVSRLNSNVGISLEQVGKCDDVIWQFPRKQQDMYYPFMDNLHTIMAIERTSYNERDIKEAQFNLRFQDLYFSDRLTLGMVLARGAVLYSIHPQLTNIDFVRSPKIGYEQIFPKELNTYINNL